MLEVLELSMQEKQELKTSTTWNYANFTGFPGEEIFRKRKIPQSENCLFAENFLIRKLVKLPYSENLLENVIVSSVSTHQTIYYF